MIRTSDRPASGVTEAATFRARGVAVPFTAPMLASARVRTADRGGVELILPNPSGGPGVFITDWPGATSLRTATLHDTLLFRRIARLGAPNPRLVREAALSVAEEGHAGPAAVEAARVRRACDHAERQRLRDLLIGCFSKGQPDEANVARALGVAIPVAATALRIASDSLAPIGLAPGDPDARLSRTIARLDATADEIADWIARDPAPDFIHDTDGVGAPIAAMLRAAAEMGRRYLHGLRRCLGEPPTLLRRAAADPQSVRDQADRALWLMDGWERLSLLWKAAESTAMRRLALLEIAQGLPTLPTEALSWTDPPVSRALPPKLTRQARSAGGGLTGAASLTLTRRNETLRALSL
jgi:hypothetical protein